jgi:outer membrane lipoprotein carrier protein
VKFLLIVCGLLANLAFADSLATKLETQLATFQSLSGSFSQEIMDESGDILDRTSGNFSLLKPSYFRWHIATPGEQLLLLTEGVLVHYDADLETATREVVDSNSFESPLAILAGSRTLTDHYRVSESADGDFILEPIADRGVVSRVALRFEDGRLARMEINDRLRQVTEIRFSEVLINPGLTADSFLFDVPEGVDFFSND